LNDIVLYCKSYHRDFLRLRRLLESIHQFNTDRIPFYISTPIAERDALCELLGTDGYCWVSDESIVAANPNAKTGIETEHSGSLSQQVIKSEFWRLQLARNYVCIDSDSIFIRAFSKHDFLAPDGQPYTVLHQNKDYFQLATDRGHARVEQQLRAEAERVKEQFQRIGPTYYCAPAPFIWSAAVWQALDHEYLLPRGLTLWDFITPTNPESLIYGEALLKYQPIPIRAIEPLFRVYHYDWQYYLSRRLGETPAKVKQNYLGIIYQSNWHAELDYGTPAKSLPSRMLKKIKQIGRWLEAYF
jgi:hypothetical protein